MSTQSASPAATVYLDQARDLINSVIKEVAPAAQVTSGVYSDGPPTACDAPLQELVSYGIYRQFNAPGTGSGVSLLPALRTAFGRRGYFVDQLQPNVDQDTFAGSDHWIDFRVIGLHGSPLVKILMDTRCGSADRSAPPASD